MSNNIWANQQLKELQQALIDINVADEFAQRSKNILPDAIEDRQGFIIRHLNEFNIANQNNLVLYTKADAASYLESLKAQRKETEQRISILKGLGATGDIDKIAYLSQRYSYYIGKAWTIDLEMKTLKQVKNGLPSSGVKSTKEQFRDKHIREFNVHNDIKPTILTVEDANDYSESLKMQRADIELRLNILSGLQATESYIGDSNTYATELELSSHTSQTTSAHGGITPSSHIGSGGNQHALAIPNGDAGFISGADLAKLRNLTTIDTSKFVTTDQVGNGQNQIPRLDGVGELPDVNIGNLDGGTF